MMHDNRWRAGHLLVLGLLALYALLIILPLVWMVLSGFKDNQGLFLNTWGLPEKFLWENYATAWRGGVGRYFLNSIIVTGTSVCLTLFISACAAFALSRFEFRGQGVLLLFVLSS